jgi:hypothetical protein
LSTSPEKLYFTATTPIHGDAADQLDSLKFFVEYLHEDFLPPVILPVQAFILDICHVRDIPEPLADLLYEMIGRVADFLDDENDFLDVTSHLLEDIEGPSAAFAFHALLKSQLSVATLFVPKLSDYFSQDLWTRNGICELLAALSEHSGLVPDLFNYFDVVIGFIKDGDDDLQDLAYHLPAYCRNQLLF